MGDHQVYLLVLNCRLSPRRKTERDVPETAGTCGRRRRMSLRWKAKTGEPSVLMPFHLGDIRLCHPVWPSKSRRRTSPRRMAPRRMTVRRMTPRRMALRRMSPRRMTLRRMSPRRITLRRMTPRRMALRRMSPRRMTLRRMSPRRMTLRRMSPRRMALRRMAPRRMVLRRMPPRRMAPRRMPLRRRSPRRRKTETEVAETGGAFVFVCLLYGTIVESFSGCDCLISFEWRVYVVQRYVSLGDNSNSVCGCWWVIGWVCMGACREGDSRKSRFSRGMYV